MRIDYAKVYRVITSYYPMGMSPSDTRYNEYPGVISINERRKQADPGKWGPFVEKMTSDNRILMKAKCRWGLDGPSYYGMLLLHEERMNGVFYKRQIYFHLSLLDPLYTVYGLDTIAVSTKNNLQLHFDPIVFISPIDIYQDLFNIIREKIEQEYSDAGFVPFSILNLRVPSVSVADAVLKQGENPSVFQALFSGNDITNYKYIGNILYE